MEWREVYLEYENEFESFMNSLKEQDSRVLWVEFFEKKDSKLKPFLDLIYDNSDFDKNLSVEEHFTSVEDILGNMYKSLKDRSIEDVIVSVTYTSRYWDGAIN